jgi:hypothetical protein
VFERELAGGNRSLRSIQARLSNSCWREPLHSAVEHRPLLATRKAGLEDRLRISFPQFSATDPADKTVPLAQQTGFVDKMRQMGRLVPEFMVEATDKDHHVVVVYAQLIIAGCVLGKTDAEIASAVSTIIKRSAEYNARRQKEASIQSNIAAAARQTSQDAPAAPDRR